MKVSYLSSSAASDTKTVMPIRDTSAQDVVIDKSTLLTRQRKKIAVIAGVGIIVVVLVIVLARNWFAADASVAVRNVRIATVERGKFVRDVTSQGTVVAAVSPTLYAPALGTVHLLVHAGDGVKRGQTLATLDSPELRNELQRERATLASLDIAVQRQTIETRRQLLANQQSADLANVAIKAADREQQRAEDAFGQHVMSQRDYQKARDDAEAAKINYQHAINTADLQKESLEFELKAKRLEHDRQRLLVEDLSRRVNNLEVRSPVDGMVGTLAVNESASVTQNAPLVTVVDLTALEIEFQVPDSYANQLGIGMDADIAYGADHFKARVSAVSPEVKQGQVSGRLQFVSDPPRGLRQNQRVSTRILIDSRDDVLKVARGPFLDTDGGRVAYVVRDGIATRTPIATGATSVSEVEITSGLAPGDQIVISELADFAKSKSVRLAN